MRKLILLIIIALVFAACKEHPEPIKPIPVPIPPIPPALTGTVSITGEAKVGQTLIANTDSLGGSGTISYQWKRGTTNIGYNTNVYVVVSGDTNFNITVTVTRSGYSGSITSEPVGLIINPSWNNLSGTVSITGTAEVGQTLTANTTSLSGSGTISYYWKRGDTYIGTNKTYYVPFSDANSTITVTVFRANLNGSITSDPVNITIGDTTVFTPGLAFSQIKGHWKREDNVWYTIDSYSVSKGTATAYEVIIPSFYNGLPVTAIPELGFSGYTNMTSIKISNSVTQIDNNAFYGCSGLTRVTFQGVYSPWITSSSLPGDLCNKYMTGSGGPGTYTRESGSSNTWTKQ